MMSSAVGSSCQVLKAFFLLKFEMYWANDSYNFFLQFLCGQLVLIFHTQGRFNETLRIRALPILHFGQDSSLFLRRQWPCSFFLLVELLATLQEKVGILGRENTALSSFQLPSSSAVTKDSTSVSVSSWWLTTFCNSIPSIPVPSSGFHGHQVCIWCTYVHAGKRLLWSQKL